MTYHILARFIHPILPENEYYTLSYLKFSVMAESESGARAQVLQYILSKYDATITEIELTLDRLIPEVNII